MNANMDLTLTMVNDKVRDSANVKHINTHTRKHFENLNI